ncbi:hypothetical protein OHA70_22495 [Kribbella sp. NBC_00382]|uniref:hypothetical protein n=1 Tax=Kribbella sp. NBC_00382 TaxID=2975967 RepID=UPI002E22DC1C
MGAVFGWGLSGHAFEAVAEGDRSAERLDEEHVGPGGFGVREILAGKLKQWAESSQRPGSEGG